MFKYISENIRNVKDKIATAALKSNRNPNEIVLVAVSKTFPEDAIKAAVEYGITDIGESRLQEAEPKICNLGNIVRWHMIGHLQTNKIRKALPLFNMIQSLDSFRLAEEINRFAARLEKKIDCLLEVNSSGERSKFGIDSEETPEMIVKIGNFENINLCGLMTIGPLTDDFELIRRAFRLTRRLFAEGRNILGDTFSVLSMGMSADYEMAIEEGSNMVRVGTAIFGSRSR